MGWYGIDREWFQSYFSYRCQIVKGVDGKNSKTNFRIHGTPQGSVLGPILFSIYINDLPEVVKYSILILFADDSQLCIAGQPRLINVLLEKVRQDLMSVICWISRTGMRLNISKTQLIVIGNASKVARVGQVSIELDGVTILSTDSIKSLGLVIHSRLSWTQHINKVSRSYH
jgi:hypothetical protein